MRLSEHFIDPSEYGQYRFSNIAGTILSALTPEMPEHRLPEDALGALAGKYDKVVLFILDGFGWDHFERLKDNAFIKSLSGACSAVRLATQFPSTTACNITTINTGLSVAEHGVYEWFYYEPKVGEVIAPLLYSYGTSSHERETLKAEKGLDPADIYPKQSFHKKLADHGVRSYAFQYKEYAFSTYTDAVFDGARRYGYITPADGLVNLAHAVIDQPAKAYYYFYFDMVDALSHRYGPGSKEIKAEIEAFFLSMEHIFWDMVKDKVDHTLFMLTADHGQTTIDPSKCVYLNLAIPGIKGCMKLSKSGRYMAPAGSCRDMFLYIKESRLDEACRLLKDKLNDIAVVVKVRDLVENGYFGDRYVSEALAGRLGNLVILPYEGNCVWWYEKDVFEVNFRGHHGGLTKQEIEIPFLAWEL